MICTINIEYRPIRNDNPGWQLWCVPSSMLYPTPGTSLILIFVFLISSILHHHPALGLLRHALILDRLLTFHSRLKTFLFRKVSPYPHSHHSHLTLPQANLLELWLTYLQTLLYFLDASLYFVMQRRCSNNDRSNRVSGGRRSLSEVQGRLTPVDGLGTPEAEAVCRHYLHILTPETINIWKFCTIHLLILDQYVSQWGRGAERHFGG